MTEGAPVSPDSGEFVTESPDPRTMMLEARPSAALEYWFFKVNDGEVALLVDWIARRRAGTGTVRISIHAPTGREVLQHAHPTILRHGAAELAPQETSWRRSDVRWHLALTPSARLVRPQIFPAAQLGLFDMSLVSCPRVLFDGWIEHRGRRYAVRQAAGMVAHYWGRALPREWWWISANQFGGNDDTVEAMALRTRLWGLPVTMPLGYVYVRNGQLDRLVLSPPARFEVAGSPEAFVLTASPLRGPVITLNATGRAYASLGDGILNTLVGDVELRIGESTVGQARATAALERRSG
jgi:hypothetical protein